LATGRLAYKKSGVIFILNGYYQIYSAIVPAASCQKPAAICINHLKAVAKFIHTIRHRAKYIKVLNLQLTANLGPFVIKKAAP